MQKATQTFVIVMQTFEIDLIENNYFTFLEESLMMSSEVRIMFSL